MKKNELIAEMFLSEAEERWVYEITKTLLNSKHSLFFLKVISFVIEQGVEYEQKKWKSEASYHCARLCHSINSTKDIAEFNSVCSDEHFSSLIELLWVALPKEWVENIINKIKKWKQ